MLVNPKQNPVMMKRGHLQRLPGTSLTRVKLTNGFLNSGKDRTGVLSPQEVWSFNASLLIAEKIGRVTDSENSCVVDKL